MIIYPDPAGGDKKEGGVRPPPQPPITVRTMDSDIKSMQENGGGVPQEQLLNTPRPPAPPSVPKPNEDDMKVKIPGYAGPEKGVFSSVSLPTAERGVDLPGPTVPQLKNSNGGSMGKIVALVITIAVAVLIGVGLYFYVYPLLLSSEPVPSPSPIIIAPTPVAVTPSPTSTTSTHVSLVKSDKTEEVTGSLAFASKETPEAGKALIKEVILKKDGSTIPLSFLFPSLISEVTDQDIKSNFEEDYTLFIYYDENGVWPGLVFRRKQGTTPFSAQSTFHKIETSKSLNNLFIQSPGAQQGDFKTGNYKGSETHYMVFANKGAAVNYAWNGDFVMLTTTFPALKSLIDGALIAK